MCAEPWSLLLAFLMLLTTASWRGVLLVFCIRPIHIKPHLVEKSPSLGFRISSSREGLLPLWRPVVKPVIVLRLQMGGHALIWREYGDGCHLVVILYIHWSRLHSTYLEWACIRVAVYILCQWMMTENVASASWTFLLLNIDIIKKIETPSSHYWCNCSIVNAHLDCSEWLAPPWLPACGFSHFVLGGSVLWTPPLCVRGEYHVGI